MRNRKLFWRTNHNISTPQVRVIGKGGKQIGVMKLSEALAEAQKAGLDLIEIAPKAKPPVAKIADLGKFRYQEEKKIKKQQKGAKASELKEVRFSPFIAEHDFQVRLERINEFLQDNNKVRVVVVFKGRHMGSKQFGYELLKKIVDILDNKISVDMEPKFVGRHLGMVISPLKKTKKAEEKDSISKINKKK